MMTEKNMLNIPAGMYCYDDNGICPYWSLNKNMHHDFNGYCSFLDKGDWQLDNSNLFDQCKQCNVFTDINEFDYNIHGIIYEFFYRFKLFKTISYKYNIIDKIKIMLINRIGKCKICKKYYIITEYNNNPTTCKCCKDGCIS